MTSPIAAAGGTIEPSNFAPLAMDRMITGEWSQRSPLRDAAVPYIQGKYYGASRFDSILGGGFNAEISSRLTLIRRPGSSVYNSAAWPAINRFYEFNVFSGASEDIRMMVDTNGAVYDGTGPSRKLNIWNKSAAAGSTYFQSVGNTLFFGNGTDQKKWVQSSTTWTAGATIAPGTFIVDSNLNLQVAWGGITCGVLSVQVAGDVLTLTLDPNDPNFPDNLAFLVGVRLALSGFDVATFLNGQTITIGSVVQGQPFESNVLKAAFTHADIGPVEDVGAVSTGSGVTGATEPAWQTTPGAWTLDPPGQQWKCGGPSVEDWAIQGPLSAPTVVQSALPQIFPAWAASTYYSTCFLIVDEAGFIQMVTGFGSTGSAEPTWNETPGGTTADNTVIWTNQNSGTYAASTAYAAGRVVVQTDSLGNQNFYQAVTGGTTGATAPTFPAALGSQVQDGTVVWEMVGIKQTWSDITASSMTNNFIFIPVAGGGFVAVGLGQGQANGTVIALPTGYSTSNLLSWSTPGTGFSGTEISGVFQSTSAGGATSSSFQNRSGGMATAATSNWAAATWTAGAAVTVTTIGTVRYLNFTTLLGDELCLAAGSMNNGATISVPSGFLAAQFVNIAGMSGSDNVTFGLNVIDQCSVSAGGVLTTLYDDNSGHTWAGPANVFGVFWQSGGGVTSQSVTGGTSIIVPTHGIQSVAFIQSTVAGGANFSLPSGFTPGALASTCAMSGGTLNGSHVSHGWQNNSVTGLNYSGNYSDSGGIYTNGQGNIFAISAVLSQTPISQSQTVVDSNNNLQTVQVSGVSGSTAPAWMTLQGTLTNDNGVVWTNTGVTTGSWTNSATWGYAWKSSITKEVTNMSPASKPLQLNANNLAYITGLGTTNPAYDTVVIYRTVQGGTTYIEEDEIPMPPAGQMWQYSDEVSDDTLSANLEVTAARFHVNDPPPVGLVALTYHLGRIFGAVGNTIYYSAGPDVGNGDGSGNAQFPPLNTYVLPSRVVRMWPNSLGLQIHTVSDVYMLPGSGTADDPLGQPYMFEKGMGLLHYDAFTVNGSTALIMQNTAQVKSFDPASGINEIGFPVGDQFTAEWDPALSFVTWHEKQSGESALYVSDGSTKWKRMNPVSPPESGFTWSPSALLQGGSSAVQSVEVTPGVRELLIGPQTSGPILMRDDSVFTDNGTPYPMQVPVGSLQLAQTGQIAELAWFLFESNAVGTIPTVGVRLGEIAGDWNTLYRSCPDPPDLPESDSLYNDRYYFAQNQETVWCRHLQFLMTWPAEDAATELLQYALFGAVHQEKVSS